MGYNNNNAGMHTIWHFPIPTAKKKKKEITFPVTSSPTTKTSVSTSSSHVTVVPDLNKVPYMAMYRFDIVARNVYTIALRDESDITTILEEISLSMKGKKKPKGEILDYRVYSFCNVERVTVALSMLSEFLKVDFLKMVRGICRLDDLTTGSVRVYLNSFNKHYDIYPYLQCIYDVFEKDNRIGYKYSSRDQIVFDIVSVFEYLKVLAHELGTTVPKLFEISEDDQKQFAYRLIKTLYTSDFNSGEIYENTGEAELTIKDYDLVCLGYIKRGFKSFFNMNLSISKTIYPDNGIHYELVYAGYLDKIHFMSSGAVLYEEEDGELKAFYKKAFEENAESILAEAEEEDD